MILKHEFRNIPAWWSQCSSPLAQNADSLSSFPLCRRPWNQPTDRNVKDVVEYSSEFDSKIKIAIKHACVLFRFSSAIYCSDVHYKSNKTPGNALVFTCI